MPFVCRGFLLLFASGGRNGWAIAGDPGVQRHTATFALEHPLTSTNGLTLQFKLMEDLNWAQSGPMLDKGLAAFIEDMDQRDLLSETLVVAIREFGRSPQKGVSTSGNVNSADGRDHWPYCYTSIIAG